MNSTPYREPVPWSLAIHNHGRCGRIEYREDDQVASVEWEFGGGDVVAIIMSNSREEWDRLYPWAAGRQTEILLRIGAEVVARKAPSCVVDFDPNEPRWLYIRDSRKKASGSAPPLPPWETVLRELDDR